MNDRPSGIAYLPGLDGLRALAIAAVLAFHDGRLHGGFLGVSIFFTISGYLITALVLAERRATGSVSLRAFYGRRARRLLPAAIAGLLLAALVTPYLHDPRVARALPGDVVAALANVANWHFLLAGRSYAAQFTSASPVLQFWSLSLEEQLYIVLVPCIVAVLWWARGRRLVLGGVLAALAAASLADGWVAVAHGSIDRAYYGTGTRAVEFLGGALLAVAVGRRAPGPRASRAAACAGPVALGALAAITLHARPTDTWLFRGEFAACTAASVVLIVSVAVPGPMRWFFSLAPLRALGKVSYGVYVYHWPLFLLLDHTRTGLAPLPLTFVRVGATVALATVSYFVIEQPIRVQRFPRVRWGWVAAPVAAMTAVSAAVIVAANAPPPAIQFQPVESASSVKALAAPPPAHSRPRAPRVGGARGTRHAPPVPVPRRVLVAGDSVALTLGRGVERWGMRNGISVLNGGVLGCTLMYDGLLVRGPLDQIFTRPHDACHTQDGWARTVATYRPDVVVVLLGAWDVYDLSWDGGRTWSGAGQPEFDAHYLAVVRAATLELAAYGAHVLWLNPPCFGRHAGDNSTASSPWYDPARVAALGRMQQEVAHATHEYATEVVHTLGCPVDYTARPDGVHYTDAAADAVMPALGPVIEALLPR